MAIFINVSQIKILFLHHSTGGLLLRFGLVRQLLAQKIPHIQLWDHSYNLANPKILSRLFGAITFKTGLSDQNGHQTGQDFNIVISNNSPAEYADIFSRDQSDPTLGQILQFDIIIFKNCFPTTKITSDEQLISYQSYYSKIIKNLHKYPQKLFIIFTPPPLRREVTHPDWAARARQLSTGLAKQQTTNVKIFDFFDLLSDKEGSNAHMLRRDYCTPIPFDSHPNIHANRTLGPILIDFILSSNYTRSIC